MSWEDVDLNHSSSVHLRDLGKLVSAFSEKQHSPFEVNADEQLSRFLVPDGVTSQRMSCNSDDQRLNKPSFTHVNARLHEAENILLAEHFNENTREEKITGESPLELASTSDLCEATHEKNSLYLINELCDRLIAKASQSSERNDDYLKTEAISDTPIICAAERSTYSEACEQISYSVPNTYESYYGFIDDNSHLSILNTSHNGSHDSMSVPSEQNGTIMLSIEKTSYATEISGQNCLAKKHQALESNKPTGAISQIQQMVEQLSPPLERIPLTQGPDVISELSHDDTPQCNSLECHDIHDTGGSASATPSPQSSSSSGTSQNSPGKYSELLAVIEELGKDIRPTYAGSKNAAERLKKGIMHARVLVRECLVETDKCARQ